MAEMYTAEEIQDLIDLAAREQAQFGRVSAATRQALEDARKGIKNWTSELKASQLSFKRSLGDLAASMTESAKGASQYGDSLSKGADYVSNWFSGKGPWGYATGQLIKGATMYVNAVTKQSDALFKSYNDISRSGATAAGGITELYGTMQKFGYGIAELGNLAGIVAENANNLALLGGTVFEGTQRFADLSKGIRDSELGARFERMGISVDNQNKGIANYLRIITMTGQQQLKTQEELRAGAEAYILQQDRLTKLTGATADEQQRIREEALSEERFAASQAQLRRRAVEEGNEALAKEADAREEMNIYLRKNVGPGVAQGFRDMTTGFLNSKDAQKFYRSFPDAARLIREGADPAEIQSAMRANAKATSEMTSTLGMAGRANEYFADQAELIRLSGQKDYKEALQTSGRQQDVNDAATDSMVGVARAQRQTRDALQDLVQIGIRPVTAGMEGLAKVISTVTGIPSKAAVGVTGGAGGTQPGGLGARPTGVVPPGGIAKPPSADYLQKMIQAESGGRNIANMSGPGGRATSSAFGIAQITKGTFEGLVKKAGTGNPLAGKTFEDMKADVGLQTEAARQLTDQNRQYLAKMGVSTSDAALYLAHFLGPGGAVRALSQPDNASIMGAVDPNQYMANPNLQKMKTVGDLKAWADQKMGGGGYQYGGIASGPETGYRAMLHGTEAIVPLPDGKKIPVDMPGFTANLADQTGIMAQQLVKLDELVRVMQNQVGISHKILQRSS
jgi:hypothetical protein